MIKINLLPQRKAKRVDPGQKSLLVGAAAIGVVALIVYLVVHLPVQSQIAQMKKTNQKLQKQNEAKEGQLKEYNAIKAAVEALDQRKMAIEQLNNARVTPANLLHELNKIMTPGKQPTMTTSMAQRVLNDPNRRFSADWDPKNVWLVSFSEKKGTFKLVGGAQADGDYTQLAQRLQASIYFSAVNPKEAKEETHKGGISFYRFTITGKVVY